MSNNGRISLVFISHLLLYFLIGELNFTLGRVSLYFHGEAVLIIFFALYIGKFSGLLSATLLGFLADSASPVPHGTFVAGYLIMWLFMIWGKRRIRRENQLHVRTLAAAAQFIWMVVLSILMLLQTSMWIIPWNRILTDLVFSTAVTFVLAWPWCQLQKQLLQYLGWNLETELSKI